MRWIVDGNNVYGSRPDGWWNDRDAAARRFAQEVAEWCRTHDDPVVLVFDAPVSRSTLELAGGNLSIEASPRRGRNAADDHIVTLAEGLAACADQDGPGELDLTVVTSDRGLRDRLPGRARVIGAGRFLDIVES